MKEKKIVETKKLKTAKKAEKFKKNLPAILSSALTLLICVLAFILLYNFYLKDMVIETTKVQKEVTVTDTGIADAVEKIYDSVVVVETYRGEQLYGTGTGFVFKTDDKNGYILTNYHVINGGDQVKVVFTNNEKEEVKVINGDEYADVAVLSISKDKIVSVAEIGKSEELRVGDTTFAVGAPIDSEAYSWSVTRGILSGKNRVVEIASSSGRNNIVMEVLQTDAAINSGNSGGPLCNSNGEVIGITNMKLASNTIEGMGFAIPIETAIEYANKFINGETVSRPYIGVSIYDATTMFGINTGVYIDGVEKGSPADKAGLKSGDKILKVNDKEVSDSSYFKFELYKYKIGDEIKITVERNKKEKDVKVTLASSGESA